MIYKDQMKLYIPSKNGHVVGLARVGDGNVIAQCDTLLGEELEVG
jgi:hypothetical protein